MTSANRGLRFTLLAVLTAVPLSLSASTFIVTDDELDPEVFPQVADSIRANLEGPNAPRRLSSAEIQKVRQSLDRIESYLEDDPDGNDFKIRTEQKNVNSALAPRVARNDGESEVVCRRVKRIGTNIPITECKTRAEMERDEYLAEQEIDRLQQGKSIPGDG